MSLEKMFLDILSPDWYTQIDDEFTPVGEYQLLSDSSQVGDAVFGYSALSEKDNWLCGTRANAIQDAKELNGNQVNNDDKPFIYKVYGTVGMNAGEVCAINPENVEQVPLRNIDGELTVVSEQQAFEIDEEEEALEDVEEIEIEEAEEVEQEEESFFSLFDDDETYEDVEAVEIEEEELTDEDISAMLRSMDSALMGKSGKYDKGISKNTSYSSNKSYDKNDVEQIDKDYAPFHSDKSLEIESEQDLETDTTSNDVSDDSNGNNPENDVEISM